MSFPRYPAYKPSGVEWLGEVPEHWGILPVKRLASLQSGTGITSDSISEDATYPVFGGNGVRGFSDSFTHEGYYPIIGRQGALCGNINYATGRFWASEHAVVVSPAKHCEVRWLGETLRAMNLNQYSTSAAQPGLSVEMINTLMVPCPPQKEQAAIATFLVRETAKIAALIAEQQRLIELLQEKRQAVISHAVTKGLNPDAPMKDSGVEWLGEVPEHWEVAPLKHHWLVTDCKHVTAEFTQEGYPLASIKEVQGRWVDLENAKRTTEAFYKLLSEGNRSPEPGDLVFTRNVTVGEVAEVPDNTESFALGQDVVLLKRLHVAHSSSYAWNLLRSAAIANQLECAMIGSTFRRINVEQIKALFIPLPPAREQVFIAAHLEKIADQWAQQEQDAQQCISLLQERRSALISAAVTGQIDVRGLAPGADAA